MTERDDASVLSINNIEQLNCSLEYDTEYQNTETTSAFSTVREIPENNEQVTSSTFVTARSRDSIKLEPGTNNLNPVDIAIQLYDIFKHTENLCLLPSVKFDNIEFNDTTNFIINQISSTCRFILPWNAIKLLLGIFWVKTIDSLDNRDLTDLDQIKIYYLLKILKFEKPFLTVQRFAEILIYKPYNNINKLLNSTMKLLFIRETNYIKEPIDLLSNDDVIALVNIANKWRNALSERIQQMGLGIEDCIWTSTELEKIDKKDYPQTLVEDKINVPIIDDISKRDITEETSECPSDTIQSKRLKL